MTDAPVPDPTSDPSDALRISDTERESAMSALGEHMSAGRLDVNEYGDRSSRVTVAKTRAELRALFTDLPDPKPRFGGQAPSAVSTTQAGTPVAADEAGAPATRSRTLERVATVLVPLSALIALALFLWLDVWQVFLLPAAASVLAGAVLGDDWRGGHRHGHRYGGHRRDERRDRWDDRRERRDDRRDRRDRYRD